MKTSKLFSKPSAVLSLIVMAIVAVVASAMPIDNTKPPKTLRLYVFDCGVIEGIDLERFNFKKEELAETRMAILFPGGAPEGHADVGRRGDSRHCHQR